LENLDRLVNELRKLSNETQWLEFKHNNYDPVMIGQDISALANSAAIYEKSCAYMLWGIDDCVRQVKMLAKGPQKG
jgi:ATP-dependent DNA helicase RecG